VSINLTEPKETAMHTLFRNSAVHADGFRDADAVMLSRHLQGTKVVDVRDPDELTGDLGHIEGVTNVPLSTLPSAAGAWDREQEIVLVCRSGGRSARAARYLVDQGFTRVINLRGGMALWNEVGLPVVGAPAPFSASG
jgi:rhodanese-related sulfurtransferase